MAETIQVMVDIDTDELHQWGGKHADAGHHGVAHVLYATARELETGRVPAFLNGGVSAPDDSSAGATFEEFIRHYFPENAVELIARYRARHFIDPYRHRDDGQD